RFLQIVNLPCNLGFVIGIVDLRSQSFDTGQADVDSCERRFLFGRQGVVDDSAWLFGKDRSSSQFGGNEADREMQKQKENRIGASHGGLRPFPTRGACLWNSQTCPR